MCGQLSSDQRTVLLLRVIADLSTEDVAQVTGKSVGAVKSLQRRALTTLRRLVGKESVPL
jgi:RNA polymerase sigma-70 factor (ECF subfamily)